MFSACGVGVEPRTPQNLIRIGLVGFAFCNLRRRGSFRQLDWWFAGVTSETAESVRVLDFEPFVAHSHEKEIAANLLQRLLDASRDESVVPDAVLVAPGSACVCHAQFLALLPVAAVLA